ncbi:ATP-binding protein [Paracoccaceae bacterium Fryx2]|nr:ATP-binding protein [Paracoccaceae bacterium Fryx2]
MTIPLRVRADKPEGTMRITTVSALLTMSVLLIVLVMVMLALDVRRRLDALDTTAADNVQWALIQTEVELLRLQTELLAARVSPDAPLDMLRLRFDVLFGRAEMLRESRLYGPLLGGRDYAAQVDSLHAFIGATVPLIDGPDAELRAALPGLTLAVPPIYAAVRDMTLRATVEISAAADSLRAAISDTLHRLAALTLLLVAALSVLAVALFSLYRRAGAQAEENRRTGERLQTIISTSADAIIVTDSHARITEFNPAAESIFGHARAAVVGRDAMAVLFPDDVATTQRARVAAVLPRMAGRTGGPLRLELDARRADGTRFPMEVSLAIAPESAEAGKSGIIVAFLRDILDRRRAEAALTEALGRAQAGEKARADFMAVMSHEMRTPLNGLIGSVVLLADTGLDSRQRKLLGVLETTGQILLDHVNSVLDVARAEAGDNSPARQSTDLDRLIEDCVANQAGVAAVAGNRVQIRALSGPIGWVRCDPSRLRQIVLNLLGNAVKFTRDGEITVETEVLPGADKAGQVVEFRFIDTGIGIPEHQIARIFEDFVMLSTGYDRATGGTGLGLGIARRLAISMGGEIGAESEPGAGSLFWLRLPLPAAPAPTLPAPPLPQPVARPARLLSVLVIEDNDINRFVLRGYLESAGHHVDEAADGLTGLARAAAQCFDVIVTDIGMPGLDGFEVCRRIRSGGGRSARARILALTAHVLPEAQAHFDAAGMNARLTKPVSRPVLLAALQGEAWPGPPPPDAPHHATAGHGLLPGHIDRLAEQVGAATLARLIGRMLDEGETVLARLAELAADESAPGAPETAAALCHKLAGSAGTFGAATLNAHLNACETAIHRGEDWGEAVSGIAPLWRRTAEALARDVERLTPGAD